MAQTLFQSTAAGIISLIQDRETDFSQEMFVSPISRYSIIGIIGKILGEPYYSKIVIYNPLIDLAIIGVLFTVFIVLGTYLFVRNERNR